jgi:solute carrier family 45 protein 1/2/4
MTDRDEHLAGEGAPLVGPDYADANDVDSLTAASGQGEFDNARSTGDLAKSKSSWYLFLLTLSIGG